MQVLGETYKSASESILMIKEIRIDGKEAYFNSLFRKFISQLSDAYRVNNFIPTLHSSILEFLTVVIIIVTVIIFILNDWDLSALVTSMIFYVAIGRRLLPSISVILSSKSSLGSLDESFKIIQNELNNCSCDIDPSVYDKTLPFKESIRLENVCHSYNSSATLKNISIEIKKGQRVAFVGGSGAGKSTLVGLLSSLIYKNSGDFYIDCNKIDNLKGIQGLIGYVPQIVYLIDDSIEKNIAFGESYVDQERLTTAVDTAHLRDFIDGLTHGAKEKIGEHGVRMSGGQRQRVGIARALYKNPDILIFDEATSALDSVSEKSVSDSIGSISNEKTVIVVAHRLNTIKDFDVIYVMKDGEIVASGRHDELIQKSEVYRGLNLMNINK